MLNKSVKVFKVFNYKNNKSKTNLINKYKIKQNNGNKKKKLKCKHKRKAY